MSRWNEPSASSSTVTPDRADESFRNGYRTRGVARDARELFLGRDERRDHRTEAVAEREDVLRVDPIEFENALQAGSESVELGLEIHTRARRAMAVAEPAALDAHRCEPGPRECTHERRNRVLGLQRVLFRRPVGAGQHVDARVRSCRVGHDGDRTK